MSAATATYKNSKASSNSATALSTATKGVANAYCDVCFKKGLPEAVYKSHFTKSAPGPAGVVCCPTILAAVCRYCGKNGHWANEKFCSAMRADAKNERRFETVEKNKFDVEKKKPVVVSRQQQNTFAALNDDSDDEDEVVAPMPAVMPVVAAPLPKAGISWADMAKKPAILIPREEEVVYYTQREEKQPIMSASEKEAYKILLERRESGYFDRERISWSQMMDEDDEDEDW